MTLRLMARVLLFGAALAGPIGCRSDTSTDTVVTDSAGVRTISVSWDAAPILPLDTTHVLAIGGGDEFKDTDFHKIRGIAFLGDSTLFIVDGGAQQIVRIDMITRSTARIGQRGDGPFEFRGLTSLIPAGGGNLYAVDAQRRRIVEFSASGDLVAEHAFPPEARAPGHLYVALAGPATIEGIYVGVVPAFSGLPDGHAHRAYGALARFTEPSDTLTGFLGASEFISARAAGAVMFGASTLMSGSESGVWIGDTATPMVERWAPPAGLMTRVVWTTRRTRELTPQRLQRFWSTVESNLPSGDVSSLAEMKQTLPFADSIPAFGSLVTGPREIWIADQYPPEARYFEEPIRAQEWLVVDWETGDSYRVVTPPGFSLRLVTPRHLVGVHRDALGAETVRLYPAPAVGG